LVLAQKYLNITAGGIKTLTAPAIRKAGMSPVSTFAEKHLRRNSMMTLKNSTRPGTLLSPFYVIR
jgi:hypothetical protein